MNAVLLKVEPADFARLVSKRRKAVVPVVLLCMVEGAAQEPLLAVLRAHGRTIRAEQNTITQLTAFIWGAMANLVLGKVAAVLVLGFIVYTIKGFTEGAGPGWEAGACFGGALVAMTAKVLIHRFALSPSNTSSV